MGEIVDVYHDECKEGGYWHGFFVVPRKARADLLSLLNKSRKITKLSSSLHYVNTSKAKKTQGVYLATKAWTSIGTASLQQQKLETLPSGLFLGASPGVKRPRMNYGLLPSLMKCKLSVVKIRNEDGIDKMFYRGINDLRNIEITFRMALQGALHRFYDQDDQVKIGNIYIDGDEHYKGLYKREFDTKDIMGRLKIKARDYISFSEDSRIIPQRSDHNKIEKNQNYDDSQFLQMCDILIGGVRFYSAKYAKGSSRCDISFPCKVLLEKNQESFARMEESRFFNSFLLSEAWIEKGEEQFSNLKIMDKEVNKSKQKSLFDKYEKS